MVARQIDGSLEEMVSVREAAKILRVSESTVWRWIRDGLLKSYRQGPKRIWLRREDMQATAVPARVKDRPSDNEIRRYMRPMAPEARRMTPDEIEEHFRKLEAEIEELKRQGKPLWDSAVAINDARKEYSLGR